MVLESSDDEGENGECGDGDDHDEHHLNIDFDGWPLFWGWLFRLDRWLEVLLGLGCRHSI
jgi:hypothetical protein